MKKMAAVFLALLLLLAGCASAPAENRDEGGAKKSRIEIRSMEDDLLATITNQETIVSLLDQNGWTEITELSENLIPETKLLLYQEKTLLAGQDPAEERDYELIETILLFQDSPCAVEVISGDVVKNMVIPSGLLTFYYELPDSTVETIHSFLNS